MTQLIRRRRLLQSLASASALALGRPLAPAWATSTSGVGAQPSLRVGDDHVGELVIARTPFLVGTRTGSAVTINGAVPGPLLRLREGETATLRVTNRLEVDTSIHWHGLLVPSDQDGVPGLSFAGIRPGETFTYRLPIRQSGTYWYHSHSGFQEQQGHYAPLIIEPIRPDPFACERDYVVQLSDWTFMAPEAVFARLKKQGNYFNYQQRTVSDFARDVRRDGLAATAQERWMWARMRMDPTDILDVTGYAYTYLMNGHTSAANWTAVFRAGERVRLRFIDSGAQTYFNVRIPGLPMTIVEADGQPVQPITVDEFQFGPAETYDIIVEPHDDRAYTIFAEAMDRSGHVRGTLAPRPGMAAAVPALRAGPLRSMADMGMDMGMGMDQAHGGASAQVPGRAHASSASPPPNASAHGSVSSHGNASTPGQAKAMSPVNGRHDADTHGRGNSMIATVQRSRTGEPGTGLQDVPHRVLTYNDLKSRQPAADTRKPTREIEMHLTGNMEGFIWGIDGKKFSEAPAPVMVRTGERVRITLVNDTMMEHPMHLHGVFMELDNGTGPHKPRKHTITVKPAERLSFEFTYDEPGNFAFHCHMLLHMEAGMFRFFNVSGPALWRQP